ncbi:SDR family NAD(P)-dependent oxidoreductase [Sphingopyxis sp.]|uniref:SDR family NAD(P)-dependent oxidoreductase n=1 Tax=Sphingopyxis sp. TaxID=1908224 RepID=UPI002D7A1433|nr:SDR family oxidoreductase [Sphingopyxis sp.]HET6526375.1 SDR family oxidoreductase [Sphingopyxis sp.]
MEPFDMAGKVVLVTGGARGQGAAEARLFAKYGAKVVIADLAEAEAGALAATLPDALALPLDIADESQWQQAMARLLDRYGRLDVLINNAAIVHYGMIETMPLDEFMNVMAINTAGTFLGMKTALPALSEQRGAIINISSISGLTGRVNHSAYLASKWAVRGLSKAAALEFADKGIRVNTIVPGLIATEMSRIAHGEEALRQRGAGLPVGRTGEPDDIAWLALYLASPLSGFCTGAEFVCDGGETAGMRPVGEWSKSG